MIDFFISSTAGFKVFEGRLQSWSFKLCSRVKIHNVSAAVIRTCSLVSPSSQPLHDLHTLGNGCRSMLITFVRVSAEVAGMAPSPRYTSKANWSFIMCDDLK
jgi:hypothetical protein